jgi:hypothetical protein
MSGIFRHGSAQSHTEPQLNGIQMTQSTFGLAIPLVYGQTRISSTLGWYGAWTVTSQNQGGGGKGGGNSGPTSYNYAASFVLLLCEGPINGIATTYADKATHTTDALTFVTPNLAPFLGGVGQAGWSYLSTSFPAQYLNYSSTAYIGAQNFQLGGTASMPNLTFEVQALLWSSLSAPFKTTGGTGSFTGTFLQGTNTITGITSIVGVPLITGAVIVNGNVPNPTTLTSYNGGTTATVSSLASGSGTGSITYTVLGGDIDPASTINDYLSAPTHGADFIDASGNPLLNQSFAIGITSTFTGSTTITQPSITVTAGFPMPQMIPPGTPITTGGANPFPSGCVTTGPYNTTTNTIPVSVNAGSTGSYTITFVPNTYQLYCIAQGFYLSVSETTQRAAQDFMTETLQVTNSDAIWSAGSLKLIPLGDSSVTGNGYTYIPNNGAGGSFTSPIFSFVDDDYIYQSGDDPIIVIRKGVSDTFNKVHVEFLDRGNKYNTAIAEAFDANDITINGERVMNTITCHNIADGTVARRAAQYVLQQQLYYKNVYQFKLRHDYCMLEPMDVIALTDSGLGLNNTLVRINSTELDEDDELTIEAYELPFGPGQTPQYNYSVAARTGIETNVTPPSVNAPKIFFAPPLLIDTQGGYQVWVAVNGGTNWGGCFAYLSTDGGSNYQLIGMITSGSIYGTCPNSITSVADPDNTNTLQIVCNSGSSLPLNTSISHSDADNMRTLVLLYDNSGNTEIVSYGAAALVSGSTYNLTYLRRGMYGSTIHSWTGGAFFFAKLDQNIFKMPIDPGMSGQTLSFKFLSLNQYLLNEQSAASATAYSYTVPDLTVSNVALPTTWTLNGHYVALSNSVGKGASGTVGSWTDGYAVTRESYMHGCVVTARKAGGATMGNGALPNIMIGLTSAPGANYTRINFAWYDTGGTWQIYESGTSMASGITAAVNDVVSIVWDGNIVRYHLNGVVKRSVKWSNVSPVFCQISAYNPGAIYDGVHFQPAPTQVVQDGNYLNTWAWVIGSHNPVSLGNYNATLGGTGSANDLILGDGSALSSPLDPYGHTCVMWKGTCSSTGPVLASGWHDELDIYGIDTTKSYRFSCWFRCTGVVAGELGFFGPNVSTVASVSAGATDSNPYFVYGTLNSITSDKWYLAIGVIHGSGYTGGQSGISGLYDPVTGQRVAAWTGYSQAVSIAKGSDFRFLVGQTTAAIRVFDENNTGGSTSTFVFWCRPRFEELSGLEPSIWGLMHPSSTVDPSSGLVLALGSTPNTVPDTAFTYTSTTTSVTISWTAITIYRADGTTATVTAGSQVVTGLSATNTYWSYAYAVDNGTATLTCVFATGTSGMTGSPAICLLSSATLAQQGAAAANMYNQANIPLYKVVTVTPSSGSGGGSGGGGGFCPHPDQWIDTPRGRVRADELVAGDEVSTPTGSARIRRLSRPWVFRWLSFGFGHHLDPVTVTPEHWFVRPDGELVAAGDVRLGDILMGAKCNVEVRSMLLNDTPARAVGLELESPHLYWLTEGGPLSHNPKP